MFLSYALSLNVMSQDVRFVNRSSSNACIIALQKLTFVLLCTPFLSPLPRYGFGVNLGKCSASRGASLIILFAMNVAQTVGNETKIRDKV